MTIAIFNARGIGLRGAGRANAGTVAETLGASLCANADDAKIDNDKIDINSSVRRAFITSPPVSSELARF